MLDAAFAGAPGEVKGPVALAERGAVVFRVVERSPFDKAAFDSQKDTIRESLRAQKSGRLVQALIQQQRAAMKIEVNREVLRRFDPKG